MEQLNQTICVINYINVHVTVNSEIFECIYFCYFDLWTNIEYSLLQSQKILHTNNLVKIHNVNFPFPF